MSSPGRTGHSLSCIPAPLGIWAPRQHLPQCFPNSVLSNCSKYIPSPWTAFPGAPAADQTTTIMCLTTAWSFHSGRRWLESGTVVWPVLVSPWAVNVTPGTRWPPAAGQCQAHQWIAMVCWMFMDRVLSFAWQFTRCVIFNRHWSILHFKVIG